MNAKEQYIRQGEKALTVPRAKKEEILRDLQEAFDSALEHGETDQDVIERARLPGRIRRGTSKTSAASSGKGTGKRR